MSTVFRLDSSIRQEGSVTRAIATSLENALRAELDDALVVRRDIGLSPLPSTAWAASASAERTPKDQWTDEQRDAAALAAELGDELLQAVAYIFAIPFYNFGVSQHVKTWVDLVLTDPRFSPRAEKAIAGRPAYLVIARGGAYGPGTPRDGWDHSTAWLKRIFEDIWELDVEVIESELTLADANPAMAELRDLAAQNLQRAHGDAAEHGKHLARKLGVTEAA